MAGAAPQAGGQPVATDPRKAAEGQIFKGGDIKGEGHDDFQKAREGVNAKLRAKQDADAATEAKKIEEGKTAAHIEGKAKALVEGIDISKIAAEVDSDFKLAERIRAFRVMSPENEAKLQTLVNNVNARRQKRIDALLADPEFDEREPATQPQPAAGAQQQPATQNPQEPAPAAQPGQKPVVGKPPQQMDESQLLDSKLNTIRKEFDDKFKKQQSEMEQERIRRQEAENKMKEMQQAEANRKNQEVRSNFNANAGKMGVPKDLLDVAFSKASDIVNAHQRQMTWDEIFAAMKTEYPSLFRAAKGAAPAEADDKGKAGAEGGETQKKVAVKPGTGSGAGGKAPQQQPPAAGGKKEHESFADARKALSERAGKMTPAG